MSRHRAPWRPFKYPISVYVYTALNRWYCFTKPKIRAMIAKTIESIRQATKK